MHGMLGNCMGNNRRALWGLAFASILVACSSGDDESSEALDAATQAGDGGAGAAAGEGGEGGTAGVAGEPNAGSGGAPETDSGIDASEPLEDAAVDESDAAVVMHPRLMELADETAIDLGEFDCRAPTDENEGQCRAVTDYSGLVYDDVGHQFLMFGGGHATTMTDTIFAFDLDDSLSWSELYEPTPCDQMIASNLDAELGAWNMGASGPYPRPLSIHSYDLNAFAPDQNEFILISRSFTGGYCNTVGNDVGGPIAHYGMASGAWSFSDAEPSHTIASSERDPVSGLIVVLGSDGLKLYDPIARRYTDEIETVANAQGGTFDINSLGYANHMVYFPPNDTFYYFMRGQPVEVIALKLDRAAPASSTLELVASEGTSSPHEEPGYDYDAVNELIGGGVHNDNFYTFDPLTSSWSQHAIQGASPGTHAFHALGYDPVNNVFVFRSDASTGQHTWAFRLRNAP